MAAFLKASLPSFFFLLQFVVASTVDDGSLVYSAPAANDIATDSRLHILLFETDQERVPDILLTKQIDKAGISYSVFGTGATFEGFGTKWGLALSALDDVPPEDLVVISDGRDVILNIHGQDKDQGRRTIEGFELAYRALTLNKPGAVVMSAEGQCCVSALTHATPGSYFHANGTRAERACASGEEGCLWAGDSYKLPWQNMMQELAKDSMQGHYVQDSYLNAGLVAGRAEDVKRLIKLADMKAFEDDQAVFTDLLYTWPDLLVLDYAQEMFGNMRWTLGMAGGGCNVAPDKSQPTAGLVHTETQTVPLFLHTPGKFMECLDHLADTLEITSLLSGAAQSQRLLRGGRNQFPVIRRAANYGGGDVCDIELASAAYGPPLPVQVTIEDLVSATDGTPVGGITITVRQDAGDMVGDIRGLFFHLAADTISLQPSDIVSATGPEPGRNYRGKVAIKKGDVDRVGRTDVWIKERNKPGRGRIFDVGIEVGTKGVVIDDVRETTIRINNLAVRDIVGEMGVLIKRVGNRNQKRKKRGFRKYNTAMIAYIPPMPA